MLGIPYRWYDGTKYIDELDDPEDQFYSVDGPAPDPHTLISANKSIVCAGIINLIRRKLSLPIPQFGRYPGGTAAWANYLEKHLEECNSRYYPIGTLLIRKYANDTDQGHLAVVISYNHIIHAAAEIPLEQRHKQKNHGSVRIDTYTPGYFTHSCKPEHWLL